MLKVGGRTVLLTSHNLKDRLLEDISKVCGLRTDDDEHTALPSKDGKDDKSQPRTFIKTSTRKDNSSALDINVQWHLKRSHYLKLGETDSHVFAFLKK